MQKKKLKVNYDIDNNISEDILSYSYLGKNTETGKNVFIYEYKSDYLNSKIIQKLITSSEKVLEVNHPNILKMNDYVYDGNTFYSIFDFKENLITLDALLLKKSTWNLTTIYKLLSQILSALVAIEEKGLHFGNLNPNHIYLNKQLDIQLVNMYIPSYILSRNLSDITVIEDAIFYAPEILQRQRSNNISDIYSIGVLLYFLYTCKWPYKLSQDIMKIKKELLKQPKSPDQINPKIKPQLNYLIQKCIRVNPEERWESIRTLQKKYTGESEVEISTALDRHTVSVMNKEIKDEIKQKKGKQFLSVLNSIFIIGISALLGLFIYTLYMNYLTEISKVIVPNISGMPLEAGKLVLNQQDLKGVIAGEQFNLSVPKGSIIETKPIGGREVKQNREIRIFISKGNLESTIPNFVGRTLEQVESLIQNTGIRINSSEKIYSREFPKGYILEQNITPNTLVQANTVVDVKLSKGFPVQISSKPNLGIFSDRNKSIVKINFKVEESWPTQNVRISNIKDGQILELYNNSIVPGSSELIEYEVTRNSSVEVYYNDRLAYKQKIIEN